MTHAASSPTPGSRAEVHQDARSRGWRTLGQTAIGSGVAGLLLVVTSVLTDLLSAGEAVTVAALVQALVPPVAAYLWRWWEGRQSRPA
ncbi:hypothetical protein [Nocardiopsis sp. TNDT3]|uniref:hypothetical protein n=1 Tax=Nocardiopsis sp. TNDT3 TaxID=2249354 RepID=UPI000E3C3301|nr:hypothetical protein [Nocardiopsis sp. TNDT3]